MHINEFQRMGADITLHGNIATVLRYSSALVLAVLVADGETNIHRIYHLDRGYDSLEKKLEHVGAKIERLKE